MADGVARGINWWLKQEVLTSGSDHNSVLDNYAQARADFLKSPDDTGNQDIKKIESHVGRFRFVTRGLSEVSMGDNKTAARVIHHALMFASGGFRTQCFLQTEGQIAYEWMRFDLGVGTGLHSGEVREIVGEKTNQVLANTDLTRVVDEGLATVDGILAAKHSISSWFAQNPARAQSALKELDVPVQETLSIQRASIGMAASYIAMAAVLRDGNFGAVPVLVPKSLTTAASKPPVYPFGD